MYKRIKQGLTCTLWVWIFVLPLFMGHTADAATSDDTQEPRYQVVAENTQAVLFVDPSNLAIQIENKQTGYVWGSTVDNIADKRLNQTWQAFANSALTIDYLTAGNQTRRESLEDGANIQLIPRKDGFQAIITFLAKIQLCLEVTLIENQIHVSIPNDTISEPQDVQLMKATIYPFLGASEGTAVDGYILLPDGPGALLDYQDTARKMTSPYQAPIYGMDPAIESPQQEENVIAAHSITMPVYGIVHGVDQNGLFTEITSAEEYGTIVAHKAGLATDFHWVTTEFNYRYPYRQPTSTGDTAGLQMVQSARHAMDIALSYTLLSGAQANYVGMARSYQQSLIDQEVFTKQTAASYPLALTFFGGDVRPGLLFDRYMSMTTVDELGGIVRNLIDAGIDHMRLAYTGWQKGGASNRGGYANAFDRHLGTTEQVAKLAQEWQEQEIPFALHVDYGGIHDKPSGIAANHFAQQINGQLVTVVEQGQSVNILSAEGLLQRVERDMVKGQQSLIDHLSLSGIGQYLSSDFTRGKEITRTESKELQATALTRLSEAGFSLSLTQPNAYLWSEMDHYVDVPLTTSNYTFVSQAVPFLPIVLKGYVDYTSPYMNGSANQESYLLKNIEYGAIPSFFMTDAAPSVLRDTGSDHLFSTQYDQWKVLIADYYQQMNQVTSAVGNSNMIAHEIIHSELIKVSYSNGCVIYINYGFVDEQVGDGTVGSRSFLIRQEAERT